MNVDKVTEEIKKDIAEYFISDSKEFLFRYEKLREFQTQISNRSKLMIDLMFAMECSLKALIFIESEENEKETYKKIKTHHLKQLIQKVDNSKIPKVVELINENIDLYNVSSRYTLEANINVRENGALGRLYYETIADFNWLDRFYVKARILLNYVEDKIERKLDIKRLSDIDIEKETEKANRIKSISKKNSLH